MRIRRRAFTLLELSVVIALSAMMMASIVGAMHVMLKTERYIGDQAVYGAALHRLTLLLRADGHQATAAAILDDQQPEQVLRLELPDGRVARYRKEDGQLQRTLSRGEQVLHRETFRLPDASSSSWSIQQPSGRRPQLVLIIRAGDLDAMEQQHLEDRLEVTLYTDRPATAETGDGP